MTPDQLAALHTQLAVGFTAVGVGLAIVLAVVIFIFIRQSLKSVNAKLEEVGTELRREAESLRAERLSLQAWIGQRSHNIDDAVATARLARDVAYEAKSQADSVKASFELHLVKGGHTHS